MISSKILEQGGIILKSYIPFYPSISIPILFVDNKTFYAIAVT